MRALFIAVVLAGCASIGHERVEGWPELTVYEHYVPHHVMRDKCVKYTPMGTSPEACAEFDFFNKRCDIWYSADFPPTQAVIKHERLHCAGYDHLWSTDMRDWLVLMQGLQILYKENK